LENGNKAFAQGGQKWATGLNSGSGNDALGTSNNFPVVIKTNGAERLRVKETGELLLNHVAEYAADYSLLFTNRSLVDKGWVLSQAYLKVNQNIILSGDVSGNGNTAISTTVNWANGNLTYDNRYLKLSGGTLSGQLVLNANPVNPMDASTKQYVDNSISNLPPIPPSLWSSGNGQYSIMNNLSGTNNAQAQYSYYRGRLQ